MENIEECPDKGSPSDPTSLVELCCRTVAKQFCVYDKTDILDLPGPVLDVLKFFVSPKNLHDMTSALNQCGIDTSQAWKAHVLAALGKRTMSTCERGYTDDRQHFILHHNVCPFHQRYISLHCQVLMEKLFAARKVDELPKAYTSLLYFLPSVQYLKVKMKFFKRLDEWGDIFSTLVHNIETLILTDVNRDIMSRLEVERISSLLGKFFRHRNLKGIIIEYYKPFCLDANGVSSNFNDVLKYIDSCITTENKVIKFDTTSCSDVNNVTNQGNNAENNSPVHDVTNNSPINHNHVTKSSDLSHVTINSDINHDTNNRHINHVINKTDMNNVTKNCDINNVTISSNMNTATNNLTNYSDINTVPNNVTNNSAMNGVTNNSDKNTVTNNSDMNNVINNSDKNTVTNNSDMNNVTNNSDMNNVINNSDKNTVTNNSDMNNVINIDHEMNAAELSGSDGANQESVDNSLFDEAVTSSGQLQQSETDVEEIIKEIDSTQESFHKWMREHRDTNFKSVSLCQIYDVYTLGQFLRGWKTIRRLNLEGSGSWKSSPDLIKVLLVKIGCNQFTHLRLANFVADNLVPQILYILSEHYRKDQEFTQPLDLLNLTGIFDNRGAGMRSFPSFKGEIHAVKDLCLSDIDMDPPGFSLFVNFLRTNTCLTKLRLTSVSCIGPEYRFKLPLFSILDSLMEISSLEALSLSGCSLAHAGTVSLTAAINRFLTEGPRIHTLRLVYCNVQEQLVTSDEFIEAIQSHPSLAVLSLNNNNLGTCGAQFLSRLFRTKKSIKLKELELSLCGIPGQDLLAAAESLIEAGIPKPVISKLNISGMRFESRELGRQEQLKIQTEFRKLVDFLEADYFGDEMADHVANM